MTVTNLRIPRPATQISGTQETSLHCACSQINFLPCCAYDNLFNNRETRDFSSIFVERIWKL